MNIRSFPALVLVVIGTLGFAVGCDDAGSTLGQLAPDGSGGSRNGRGAGGGPGNNGTGSFDGNGTGGSDGEGVGALAIDDVVEELDRMNFGLINCKIVI